MSYTGSQLDYSFFEREPSISSSFDLDNADERPIDASRQRVELKRCMDAAVAAGASMDIDVPQIVVLGSQSSGKSSLFEGISKVSLPRNSGTCTRCPIICRMVRKPDPWCCKIGIMREVDENGDPLPDPETIPFGPEIYSPDKVCERIQRAQLAILHSEMDPQEFVDGAIFGTMRNGFSFNSIVVDIEGPDVIDLSFVDLPGLIVDDDGETDNVERVKRMAIKYIERKCNLILLVFHCSDDIQNQGARRLARTYDPEGERTITVLTKPDKIDRGQEDPWRERLRASDQCFCVRQPNMTESRSMSWEGARRLEMEFFRKDPWVNEYNDPSTQRRLGTENLTNHLNKRLLDWIVAKLPAMQEDLRRRLRDIKDGLNRLPAEVANPIRRANELVWEFNEKLKETVNICNFKIPSLVGVCRRSLEVYVNVLIYHLFPRFRPFSGAEAKKGSKASFNEFPEALPKVPALPSGVDAIPVPTTVYLDEVMQKCDIGRTREMPGNYPYGVQKEFMENSVEIWRDQTESMLEDIFQCISSHLKDLTFGHFASIGHADTIWDVVEAHIESRYDAVRKTLMDSLKREKTCSLVYACTEYFYYRKIYLNHYRSHHPTIVYAYKASVGDILHATADIVPNPIIATAGHAIADRLGEEDIVGEITEDEEHGIFVMAETRAFYHVAVRRYAETVAQIVFHDLLLDIQGGPELEQKLRDRIGTSGPDAERDCSLFVEPSLQVVKDREELKRRQASLKRILHQLSRFS
ncbi:hypothetical protein FRC15_000851 [Serendipita sp. 397]|nr:hypothetical protein FRC15_000851 [Serendipita sp. 397]